MEARDDGATCAFDTAYANVRLLHMSVPRAVTAPGRGWAVQRGQQLQQQ